MITPDRRILPAAQAVLIDPTGRATTPFYDFMRRIVGVTGLTPELIQQLEEIIAKIEELEAGGFMPITSNVIGQDSILALGVLANGVVTIQLQGDTSDQGATWYYGSDENSEKGWHRFYTALGGEFGILKHNSGYTELGEVADPADLPPTGNIGEAYWVDGAADITERGLWAWNGAAWVLDPAATGIVSFELDQNIDPTWTGTHIFTQPTLFADGTAAAPGIAFAADINTGRYRIGADSMGDATGGVLRLGISTNITLPNDNEELQIGAGNDLRLYHDSADSWMANTAGRLLFSGAIGGATTAPVNLDANVDLAFLQSQTIFARGNSASAGPNLDLLYYRDSFSAPTLPQATNTIGAYRARAHDTIQPRTSARMFGQASETWVAGSAFGTDLVFDTVAAGATALAERMRLGANATGGFLRIPDGAVGQPGLTFGTDTDTGVYRVAANDLAIAAAGVAIGRFRLGGVTRSLEVGDGTNSANLIFNAAAGQVRDFFFQSGGSNRWGFRVNATAEGGGNSGSDLEFLRRTDAGAGLGTALRIVRSSGQWLFEDGAAATPELSFASDPDIGIFRQAANSLGIAAAGVEVARFDATATAGNTRFMVFDVDNATLERVTVGAADSGGVGFKVLRIPN